MRPGIESNFVHHAFSNTVTKHYDSAPSYNEAYPLWSPYKQGTLYNTARLIKGPKVSIACVKFEFTVYVQNMECRYLIIRFKKPSNCI